MPVDEVLLRPDASAMLHALRVIHRHRIDYGHFSVFATDDGHFTAVYCRDAAAMCRSLGVAPEWREGTDGKGRFVCVRVDGVDFTGVEA